MPSVLVFTAPILARNGGRKAKKLEEGRMFIEKDERTPKGWTMGR
jgi:hypothetical protein